VNAGRRTRSPAGNLSPSDYSSLRGSRSSDGNLGASSFLPFLSLPASQPSRCTSADPIRVCLCIRPKPLATASSSLRRLRVRSLLLSSVSSSNRRKVASVSQLGLAKKQREQQPPQSTFTSCPNLQHRVDDLAIEVSSFCPRIAQPIASDHLVPEEGCLLARPHCQQPRGAIFRLAHPPTLAPSPPSPSRTSPSSISNCQPHNPPTCRTTSLPTRCRRASSKPVVKPKT
jgi:hypothetical protein